MSACADNIMASVLAVKLNKCDHRGEEKKIMSISHSTTLFQLFEELHRPVDLKTANVSVSTGSNVDGTSTFKTEGNICVGDLHSTLGMKYVEFECRQSEDIAILNKVVKETNRQTINAFQVMMAGGRSFVQKKEQSSGLKSGVNSKDLVYNNLVDLFKLRKLDFPKSTSVTEGSYFIQLDLQVLCNALWYITNHHNTINDAARNKSVKPVPQIFDSDEYKNKNDVKRKKVKIMHLKAYELDSHTQALYSLLLRPVMKSSSAWCEANTEIKNLADCLSSYKDYLNIKAETMNANHNLDHPVRTVGQHTTVEHSHKAQFGVHPRYLLLDSKIKELDAATHYLFFDEIKHTDMHMPFTNNMQRFRFLTEMSLSMAIDIFKFSPGVSFLSTVCIVRSDEGCSEAKLLTDAARFVLSHKEKFQEFHTRAQKRAFKEKLNNVAIISPSVVDFIYKELTIDASTASHPDTQERIRLIFLGEQGLLADMRKLNPGRPTGTFDTFFQKLAEIVEEKTAVDDRRHNTAHLSEWISLSDMIQKSKNRCPENTPIPSKSLVRLQFAPRNPFAKTAWTFTNRIDVQYKIQRRQLRLSHPDEHFCNAVLKYIKEHVVEMNKKAKVVMFCCDDKAKVPIGEPGFAVSTGVRGKKTIVPTSSTLVAADHDMTKSSLTPSVTLQCKIPDSPDESFVRGQVTVTVNDSVFQTSNPFRHAATLTKVLKDEPEMTILVKYTDGGTDHRNTLESVKCATICLFKELNMDMVILGRCAPGHSWRNPAERIMSILNLGLQNCSTERQKSTEDAEKFFKKCGSMSEIRKKSSDDMKQAYAESVEPVVASIRNRFQRLKLKEKEFATKDPVSDLEIDLLKRHLRELFPELDLEKLQKQHTNKVASYVDWIQKHCRERHYLFQIRKCADKNCCLPRRTPDDVDLNWLPDPILLENGEHFRSYQDSKNKDTDETDRPTYKVLDRTPKPKSRKRAHSPEQRVGAEPEPDNLQGSADDDADINSNEDDNNLDVELNTERPLVPMTAQNARGVILCVECSKPRLCYSKRRLSGRQEQLLAIAMSEFDYTCGAPIADPSVQLLKTVFVRTNQTCSFPIETPFYGSQYAKLDICTYCASNDGIIDMNLKTKYKTVLPLCDDCKKKGKEPIVQRPYGKK